MRRVADPPGSTQNPLIARAMRASRPRPPHHFAFSLIKLHSRVHSKVKHKILRLWRDQCVEGRHSTLYYRVWSPKYHETCCKARSHNGGRSACRMRSRAYCETGEGRDTATSGSTVSGNV